MNLEPHSFIDDTFTYILHACKHMPTYSSLSHTYCILSYMNILPLYTMYICILAYAYIASYMHANAHVNTTTWSEAYRAQSIRGEWYCYHVLACFLSYMEARYQEWKGRDTQEWNAALEENLPSEEGVALSTEGEKGSDRITWVGKLAYMFQQQVALISKLARVTEMPFFCSVCPTQSREEHCLFHPSRTLADRGAISVFASGVTSEHTSQIHPTTRA